MLWADSDLTSLGGPASPDTNPAALRMFLLWAAGDRVSWSLKDQDTMLRRSWDICADGQGQGQFCSSSETKKASFEGSVSRRAG